MCIITLVRQRRFSAKDIGNQVAAFLAGCGIPTSLFLCLYVFDPDPLTVQTKLHGHEKNIAVGGLCILFVSIVTICNCCKKAYTYKKGKLASQMKELAAQELSTSEPEGSKEEFHERISS